jgi:hypothetical protein
VTDTRTMRDRAAKALCDSSSYGPKFEALGGALRHVLYHRIDYMAAAGVISDGTAEAERDKAIEDRNNWHGLAAEWEANAERALAALKAAAAVCSATTPNEIATSPDAARRFLARLHEALLIPIPKDQT